MKPIRHAGFYWRYDASADVLHVSLDPAIPAYGEALKNFAGVVVVMHGFEDDNVVGLRIIGAKRNGLREIKLLVDKERRAIGAFQVSGDSPGWKPDEGTEHYAKDLAEVERILENTPPDAALDLAR